MAWGTVMLNIATDVDHTNDVQRVMEVPSCNREAVKQVVAYYVMRECPDWMFVNVYGTNGEYQMTVWNPEL